MKEGGIVRRLFDVSVSILMAAVLLLSQSWAVTAAYADYSVNGSTDSTNLNSEDSNAIDDGSGPEGQESNASLLLTSLKTRNRVHPKIEARSLLTILP